MTYMSTAVDSTRPAATGAPIKWAVDRSGHQPWDRVEHVAHTLGHDLYVMPPFDGDPTACWIVDAADGTEVATGETVDGVTAAKTAAEQALSAHLNP